MNNKRGKRENKTKEKKAEAKRKEKTRFMEVQVLSQNLCGRNQKWAGQTRGSGDGGGTG